MKGKLEQNSFSDLTLASDSEKQVKTHKLNNMAKGNEKSYGIGN